MGMDLAQYTRKVHGLTWDFLGNPIIGRASDFYGLNVWGQWGVDVLDG